VRDKGRLKALIALLAHLYLANHLISGSWE